MVRKRVLDHSVFLLVPIIGSVHRNSVVYPDPHYLGCPRSGFVLGMRNRIQEHWSWPKFTNKPGFVHFLGIIFYLLPTLNVPRSDSGFFLSILVNFNSGEKETSKKQRSNKGERGMRSGVRAGYGITCVLASPPPPISTPTHPRFLGQ